MTIRATMAHLILAALIATLIAAGPVAIAATPYANDAIQGGSDVQPAQAATSSKERAAGIAPPAARQSTDVDKQVDTLIHQSQTGIQNIPPDLLPSPRQPD